MQRTILTSTLALAACAGVAFAQSQDTGDGTQTEISSFCAAEFTPAAAEGPGESGSEDQTTREFQQLDRDGDGTISMNEYVECRNAGAGMDSAEFDRSEENMTSADTDQSGSVSRNEYMSASENARQGASQSEDQSGEPVLVFRRFIFVPTASSDADVRGMSQGESARRSEQQFGGLDSDSNDELSPAEWSQRAATIEDRTEQIGARFDELDRDGDGALSAEEYGEDYMQRQEELGLQLDG